MKSSGCAFQDIAISAEDKDISGDKFQTQKGYYTLTVWFATHLEAFGARLLSVRLFIVEDGKRESVRIGSCQIRLTAR